MLRALRTPGTPASGWEEVGEQRPRDSPELRFEGQGEAGWKRRDRGAGSRKVGP